MRLLILVLVMAAMTACSSGEKSVCSKYADLEIRCGDIPESEHAITRKLAEGICREAMKERSDNELTASFRADVSCAKIVSSCAEYQECKDKASGR